MEDRRTKDDFRSFGISVYHLGVEYSAGWICDECDWQIEKFKFVEWRKFVVGFSRNAPKNPDRPETPDELKTPDNEYIGGIVIECPRCSRKFWFHVTLMCMKMIFLE